MGGGEVGLERGVVVRKCAADDLFYLPGVDVDATAEFSHCEGRLRRMSGGC